MLCRRARLAPNQAPSLAPNRAPNRAPNQASRGAALDDRLAIVARRGVFHGC